MSRRTNRVNEVMHVEVARHHRNITGAAISCRHLEIAHCQQQLLYCLLRQVFLDTKFIYLTRSKNIYRDEQIKISQRQLTTWVYRRVNFYRVDVEKRIEFVVGTTESAIFIFNVCIECSLDMHIKNTHTGPHDIEGYMQLYY